MLEESTMIDDLQTFLQTLPGEIQLALGSTLEDVEQITLRLGYPLMTTFRDGGTKEFWNHIIAESDLEYMGSKITGIRSDGRGGIDGTLHRIASIQNREERTIGFQVRLARHVSGVAEPFRQVIEGSAAHGVGQSIVVIGRPRVGKTTFLRDIARIAASRYGPLGVVIDTSCELGGVADVPIRALMPLMVLQVPDKRFQEKILRRAIVNYGPEFLMLDEIATPEEALQVERAQTSGVRLVATLHGGTLGDACRRDVNQCLLGISPGTGRQERKSVFDVGIEIVERDFYRVYHDFSRAVEQTLGKVSVEFEEVNGLAAAA
jgi:stage III sporulation protein SpoIIIAA